MMACVDTFVCVHTEGIVDTLGIGSQVGTVKAKKRRRTLKERATTAKTQRTGRPHLNLLSVGTRLSQITWHLAEGAPCGGFVLSSDNPPHWTM